MLALPIYDGCCVDVPTLHKTPIKDGGYNLVQGFKYRSFFLKGFKSISFFNHIRHSLLFPQGAEIHIQGNDTNFGLIRLGDCVEREVTLINTSPIEARWKMSYHSNQVCSFVCV